MPLTTPFIDLVTVFIRTAVSRRDATASIREARRRQFNACFDLIVSYSGCYI